MNTKLSAQKTGLGLGPRPQLAAWVHHHRQAAADSLQKMLMEPIATLLTLVAVGIALALPAALWLLLDNASAVASRVEAPTRLSLLLEDDSSFESAERFADTLATRVDIAAVSVLHRDEALVLFATDTGLDSLLQGLQDNPLPHTLLVTPAVDVGTEQLEALADFLGGRPEVDEVVLDTRWIARLDTTIALVRQLVVGTGALMILGAILILANTIRLAIEARRDEIVVIKLIGGGDGFARRPFLYTGLWAGIGGGLLGALLVLGLFLFVSAPARSLLALYDSDFTLQGLGLVGVIRLTLMGGAIGLLSAAQAVTLHLRRIEPR